MILIKTKEEIKTIKEGGKILSKIMKEVSKYVRPGISGKDLDKVAEDLVFKYNAAPSFKNYNGFPSALCVSINEQIIHGVPDERAFQQGDIISLDLGIFYKGFHTDMAVTLPVGEVSPEAQRLLRITKLSLKRGIKNVREGKTLGDIGNAIERCIEGQGFKVIKELCGHGIGKDLHEEPNVLNFGKRRKGEKLKEGMVLCIEPMASFGSPEIKQSKDGFGYETKDGSLSAHFEHTVIVSKQGAEIATMS